MSRKKLKVAAVRKVKRATREEDYEYTNPTGKEIGTQQLAPFSEDKPVTTGVTREGDDFFIHARLTGDDIDEEDYYKLNEKEFSIRMSFLSNPRSSTFLCAISTPYLDVFRKTTNVSKELTNHYKKMYPDSFTFKGEPSVYDVFNFVVKESFVKYFIS